MNHFGFASEQRDFPAPADAGRAELGLERWLEAAAQSDDPQTVRLAQELAKNPQGRRILKTIFGNSPYLTLSAVNDPGFMLELLDGGPEPALAGIMKGLEDGRKRGFDADQEAARTLRVAKRRAALSIAVADIFSVWNLRRVTAALSGFADAALSLAAQHLLRAAAEKGAFSLAHDDDPQRDSGLIILAMGKLGARELNYSSDIDLIVFYDTERIRTQAPDELQGHFVRLTRNLVRMLDERTADGYVFRTDLRLRPDPGATPLAISVQAAETYYESLGQNWERAAMIKARPAAGDLEAGAAFLDYLKPFIWRKSLDFATIQDIHSIKRQINAHRGGGKIGLAGHNVKLGRGGIREIEFFAQTQQLIWGGRDPGLRGPATEETLLALAERSLITDEAAGHMIDAYRFLRRTEHHLQMIDDEQTQTLPSDDEGLRRLAVFLGYPDAEAFSSELLFHLVKVETNYARLFEDSPSLGAPDTEQGNLVFTGVEPDPETISTIRRMGFENPGIVDSAIRGWHHGRYRSTRSARTRGMLTELMPMLLSAIASTSDPDAAFLKFDEFLSHLPSGVQLFAMLYSNPHLLELMAEIMGRAPRLAEYLSRRPSALDSVLAADFFEPPPPAGKMAEELEALLETADGPESVLDISRRWANDRKFQAGVQYLLGHLAPVAAAGALSDIADAALTALKPHVEEEFFKQHGRIAGSQQVVVAMGKLGGREMTPGSDLDLIFIYRTNGGAQSSDGPKPLSVSHYFARLCQRTINSITAQTTEGILYDVDMRLRPSGSAGPIASSLESFILYHREAAWTWEHMALTRARVVCGDRDLGEEVERVIAETLTRPRDSKKLLADIAGMRRRMDKERHSDFIWDVKYLRGGLIDVEFITQYLQLKHAAEHPAILSANTRAALRAIRDAGLVGAGTADLLIEALDTWNALQGMIRLTVEGDLYREWENGAPEDLRDTLARHCSAPDFAGLEAKVRSLSKGVHEIYNEMIGEPAKSQTG